MNGPTMVKCPPPFCESIAQFDHLLRYLYTGSFCWGHLHRKGSMTQPALGGPLFRGDFIVGLFQTRLCVGLGINALLLNWVMTGIEAPLSPTRL